MRVRPAVEADLGAVRRVARETWAFAYRDLIPEGVQTELVGRWYADEALMRRMRSGVLLVAEAEPRDTVVGFVNLLFNPRVPFEVALAAIYVLPAHEGRGIGTALLAAGLQACPGTRRVVAQVERGNAGGLAFYAARGFRPVRECDEDIGGGHVLRTVEMALNLPETAG